MTTSDNHQLIISGVGGQGVLFITRLLGETAVNRGYPVFTSETHGMAQRGGTVISHLKIGAFDSPLIRLGQADALLALKAENLGQHEAFLRSGGLAVVNGAKQAAGGNDHRCAFVDADALAREIGNSRSVNLIVLGFALAEWTRQTGDALFCTIDDVREIIEKRLKGKADMAASALRALDAGCVI